MNSDAFTLYKLMVLFLLDQVDFPLTNSQVTNIILDLDYTNYFNIQYSMSELVNSKLIRAEKIGTKTYYRITKAGEETLSLFSDSLSEDIQDELSNYLKEHQLSIRDDASTPSEYYEAVDGTYTARLKVIEANEAIIDIKISVPSEKDAKSICDNWSEKSQQIYAYVVSNLL